MMKPEYGKYILIHEDEEKPGKYSDSIYTE